MASIGSRFGSTQRTSAWQDMQKWRARRANAADSFQSYSETTLAGLTNAFSSNSDGRFQLTLQKANQRVQQMIANRLSSSLLDIKA